jgi:hypothetical protein
VICLHGVCFPDTPDVERVMSGISGILGGGFKKGSQSVCGGRVELRLERDQWRVR